MTFTALDTLGRPGRPRSRAACTGLARLAELGPDEVPRRLQARPEILAHVRDVITTELRAVLGSPTRLGFTAAELGELTVLTVFVALPDDVRVALYHATGHVVDGRPAPRPAAPVLLYRGSPRATADGVYWTSSPSVAAFYAARPVPAGGAVWRTLAPPAAVLGRVDRYDQAEHVVDPALLDRVEAAGIEPAGAALTIGADPRYRR